MSRAGVAGSAILALAFFLGSDGGAAQMKADKVVLLPRPMKMARAKNGTFILHPTSRIIPLGAEAAPAARYLAERLRTDGGPSLRVAAGGSETSPSDSIVLSLEPVEGAGNEGYVLQVTEDSVLARAPRPAGLFHAAQTVRQLLFTGGAKGEVRVPCLSIEDRPRFGWRGYHLDVCRHFMEKDFVKRMIELAAFHKLNRFHWHLTEDQGWRVEIAKYPKLQEISAWRDDGKGGRYGGFYTKDEIREVVAFAAERGITIVPEIELPGHCTSVLAAYPEFSCTGGPFKVATDWGVFEDVYCAGNDEVFRFLEGVLDEVADLFPGPWLHIGADECPKARWQKCPKCQARMKQEGLADEHALQTWFVRRIADYVRKHGKTVIAWDEILEGGAPEGVVVQAWRGHEPGAKAAAAGRDVIVSPYTHVYFDYDIRWFDVRKVFSFDPLPPGMPAELVPRIIGSEGLLWTEGAPQEAVDSRTFPRLCALAEVTWSPANDRDWPSFEERCREHSRRLRKMGVDVGPFDGVEAEERQKKEKARKRAAARKGERDRKK